MFCDIEPWCRNILKQHWNNVPIKSDVKELANDPDNLVPDCDILTAGYPCQPFSVAGKQKGTEDDRHIWPYIRKIVASKRPSWVVFENVYGHVSMGLDQVLLDLETEGYATRAFIVPASSVGAPHRRDRVWIVGYTEHPRPSASTLGGKHGENETGSSQGQSQTEQSQRASKSRIYENVGYAEDNGRDGRPEATGREGSQDKQNKPRLEVRGESSRPSTDVADTNHQRLQGRISGWQDTEWQGVNGHAGCSSATHRQSNQNWWTTEPNVGRVANGVSKRVDRLKGLGNAIVPQIAQQIAESIKVVENAKRY
jgi:DNA (cytosine-5)-methyltransferase 1